MKFTHWEAEFLLDQVVKQIRRNVSQQKPTKTLEKLKTKLEHCLTLKG